MTDAQLQKILAQLSEHEGRIRVLEESSKRTHDKEKREVKYESNLLDFSLNSRAFFKKYGKGLSGPKKFVLVVAYLAKGNSDSGVSYEEAEKCWKKHKTLLGGTMANNYGTRAKEGEWLDSPKYGIYILTGKWQEIFS